MHPKPLHPKAPGGGNHQASHNVSQHSSGRGGRALDFFVSSWACFELVWFKVF